jgi:hypothetical protein
MRPVIAHLTIHGQPFCDATGCMAYADRAYRIARVYCCEFTAMDAAVADALKLSEAGQSGVAIALGACPTRLADQAA